MSERPPAPFPDYDLFRAAGEPRSGQSVPMIREDLTAKLPGAVLCAGTMIALLGGADAFWCHRLHLGFTGGGTSAIAIAGMLALALVYSTIRRSAGIAEMLLYTAAWLAFSVAGGIATYLAAGSGRPFADVMLTRWDSWFGFDWIAWFGFLHGHAVLESLITLAYYSLSAQIGLSVILFAACRQGTRNAEFLLASIVALILTTAIFAGFPAQGPCVVLRDAHGFNALHINDLTALRSGRPDVFDIRRLNGLICFPSFHTALALVVTWTHRGIKWSGPAVALLNAVMLLGVPTEGCHYLSDMIGGVVVAFVATGLVDGSWLLLRAARRRSA